MRVLLAKSLHYLYEQQNQAEPPRRAIRVRDLTFLPHLLEIGKPLKHITMQDVASKIPNCNLPNLPTLLQQQIEMLNQTEWYHQCETQVLRRLARGPHNPTEGGETPAGGSPPAGGQREARETCESQPPGPPGGELPSGGSPPSEAVISDPGEPGEDNRGRLPAGGPPRAAEALQEGGLPGGGPPQAKWEHARTTTDPLTGLITYIAQQLHAFRQDHKQQQPTNLMSEGGRNQEKQVTRS